MTKVRFDVKSINLWCKLTRWLQEKGPAQNSLDWMVYDVGSDYWMVSEGYGPHLQDL